MSNILKNINPLRNKLIMAPRVYDCKGFINENHPFFGHGLTFPCGLVEVSGSGTLLSEISKEHSEKDTIDKTLYSFNPDVTDCEVITQTGDVVDFTVQFSSIVFSKYMLRANKIEKIIFKEVK